MQAIKCVLVGDGCVGKTCLLQSHQSGIFVENTCKRLEPFEIQMTVYDIDIKLQLCDTDGQDEFDHIRQYVYPETDVVLMCFSVDSFKSMQNIEQKWYPEVHHHCHGIPLFLIGTKQDLRKSATKNTYASFVYTAQGLVMAKKLKCIKYIECSACTVKEIEDLFVEVVKAVLSYRKHHKDHECHLM